MNALSSAMASGSARANICLSGRTICIVDDDPLYRAFINFSLSQIGMTVVEAENGEGLRDQVDRRMPDCILLDYGLRMENGLFVLSQMRLKYPDLAPVLILTSDETQRTAVRAFRSGVDDFLQKRNLKVDDIVEAMGRAIDEHESRRCRAETERKIREEAGFDIVTGLYNRAEMHRKMEIVTRAADASGKTVGLIVVRLAQFTEISSCFGVVAADAALRKFGLALSGALDHADLCGHFDSDLFYCLIDNYADEASVQLRRERIAVQLAARYNISAAQVDVSPQIVSALRRPGEIALAALAANLGEQLRETSAATLVSTSRTPGGHDAPQQKWTGEVESRRFPRRRVFKPCWITIHGGEAQMHCTIRNISDGGVRIVLPGLLAIPDQFLLRFNPAGSARNVRKVWQHNEEIGLAFID
jgi:two-component system cell cycle response regulator